jgi:hypothetical protein
VSAVALAVAAIAVALVVRDTVLRLHQRAGESETAKRVTALEDAAKAREEADGKAEARLRQIEGKLNTRVRA